MRNENEKTFQVCWAYGEISVINARDEACAEQVAAQMGRAHGLGKVLWVRQDPDVVPDSRIEYGGMGWTPLKERCDG